MNVHSHAQIYDLAAAVENLPIGLPSGNRPAGEAIRATGTDGRPVAARHEASKKPKSLPFPCRSNDGACENMTRRDDETDGDSSGDEEPQTSVVIGDDAAAGDMRSGEGETTPPGFEPGQREPKSLVLPLHYGV